MSTEKEKCLLQLFSEQISVVLFVSDSLSFVRFQASGVVYLKPSLFWDVIWCRMATGY